MALRWSSKPKTNGHVPPPAPPARPSTVLEVEETARVLARRLYVPAEPGASQDATEKAALRQHLRRILGEEFPRRHLAETPPGQNFTDAELSSIRPPPRAKDGGLGPLYAPGTPVETFGAGAHWHPGRVTRVVEQVDKGFTWENGATPGPGDKERFYHVNSREMYPERAVSLPMEFLIRRFGTRPLLWQQWALLRLEARMRFQENHGRDFVRFNATGFGRQLWDMWLADERNADFKRVVDTSGFKEHLEGRMLHPFRLMDAQTQSGGDWDITAEGNISVYKYLSVLGSGGWLCTIVAFIQLAVPVTLFFASRHHERSRIFVWDEDFCRGDGDPLGKVFLLAVMLLYLTQVVPELMWGSLRTIAATEEPLSRNMQLRRVLWARGTDNMQQRLGYALDMLMNTIYTAVLYQLNIVILYNTEDPTDILLNAMAIAFVHTVDEDAAASGWWDPDRRFIQAGCLELTLRASLRLDLLENPGKFCEAYHIDEDAYIAAMTKHSGNVTLTLRDPALADDDDHNPRWAVDDEDRLWMLLAEEAREMRNGRALSYFAGAPRTFEEFFVRKAIRRVRQFLSFEPMRDAAGLEVVFGRYRHYYCWSKFDELLFLPPLLSAGVAAGEGRLALVASPRRAGVDQLFRPVYDVVGADSVARIEKVRKVVLWHLSPEHTSRGLKEVMRVVSGLSFFRGLETAAFHREQTGVALSFLYGVLEWIGCIVCLYYPFGLVVWTVFLPFCY